MSFFELLVIFFISMLVIKPKDILAILKRLGKLKKQFGKTQKEILSAININEIEGKLISEDQDEINSYLKKISDAGGAFEGEYDLKEIKSYYKKLTDAQESL